MSDSTKDTGTIQALLERLNNDRLPRALELKSKVDRGKQMYRLKVAGPDYCKYRGAGPYVMVCSVR